jgi:hypothetical protein
MEKMNSEKITQVTTVFVILRCMRNEADKELWRRCYSSVRYYYKSAEIVIIDDNSVIEDEMDSKVIGTTIIKSDYTGAGEVLPFFYFLKHHWADTMIILHDSMFLKRPFVPKELSDTLGFFWHFSDHRTDDNAKIEELLQFIPEGHTLKILNKQKDAWNGWFGLSGIISWTILKDLDDKYGVASLLVNFVKTRDDRMAYERIFGLIAFNEQLVTKTNCSAFGSIHDYPGSWRADFEWQIKNQHLYPYAIMKTWSGR